MQKNTTAAAALASRSAALVGSGVALLISGGKKARRVLEDLPQMANERMIR